MGISGFIQRIGRQLNPIIPVEKKLSSDAKLSLFIHWSFTLGASMSGVFLNLYLWRLTESLAINGAYQIIIFALTPAAFAWAGSWVKKKDRMFVFRLGVIFSAIFYLFVVLAQEKVADYFYIFAVLNCLANSFYWTGYLVLMFDVSTQANRLRYMSNNTIVFTFASLIGPALAGFIISRFESLTGYIFIFTIAFCTFVITAVISFRLKPIVTHHKTYYLRFMGLLIRKNRKFRSTLIGYLLFGTFQGIIMFLPNILLFEVFSREDTVGYLGVGFSLISIIAGFLISRYGKDGHIRSYVLMSAIGFTAASCFLLMGLSVWTVLGFMILQAFFNPIFGNPTGSYYYQMIAQLPLKGELRVESLVIRELFVNSGRVISISLLIFLANDLHAILLPVVIVLSAAAQFGWLIVLRNKNQA
jgi:MFS transporter, YQGE family, putative transporter